MLQDDDTGKKFSLNPRPCGKGKKEITLNYNIFIKQPSNRSIGDF